MVIKLHRFVVLLVLIMSTGVISAQEEALTYIIEHDGELVYVGAERDIVIRETTTDRIAVGWNTSGRYFMDIALNLTFEDIVYNRIFLYDLAVPESFPIYTYFSVYSGGLVYFGENTMVFTESTNELLVSEDEQGLGITRMNVYELGLDIGLSPMIELGSIPFGLGCGGGRVRNSLDSVYNEEVRGDVYGEYNQIILAPTPYGIVHSNSCTAIRTLLTQPETLESVELSDNLRWVSVAHDGEYVVGTSDNDFILIDLETLEETVIVSADAPVVSSTWDFENDIVYFVARTTNGDFLPIEDPNSELLEAPSFSSVAPLQSDAYIWQSTLYQYDISTGDLTELTSEEAYAFGNLTIVGEALFFSQIETPLEWLQAYVDNPETADSDLIERSYWLYDFNTGDVNQLEGDYAGAFIQPAP